MDIVRSRKGVIEAQFNWIFILIVGAIILLFFVMLVRNQSNSSDMKLSADLLNNLDSIVVGGGLSIGTIYDISLPPEYSLENKCGDGENTLTFYESGMQGVDLKYNTLFGPRLLSGTTLSTYSAYWQQPFIVTPLFFMVSDKTLFFIINDTDDSYKEEIALLYKEFPVNDDDEKVDKDGNKITVTKFLKDTEFIETLLSTKNKYYTTINIVFFGDMDNGIRDALENHLPSDAKISIYQINDSNVIGSEFDTYFEVNYYEIANGNLKYVDTTGAMDINSLFGIIFSENIDHYECNMRKAIFKYNFLLDVYHNKSEMLLDYVKVNSDMYSPNCQSYYSSSSYEDIREEVSDFLLSSNPDINSLFGNIYGDIEVLRQYNIRLGDSSCPIPY